MTFIKICGITTTEQALEISGLGVNALGFVFATSPRKVSPEVARCIIGKMPPFVSSVGVFVDESLDRVREIMEYCGLDLVQLHGSEPPDFCKQLAPRVIKAFRIRDARELQKLPAYEPYVRGFLLDAWSTKAMGGTGTTFDWSLAVRAAEMVDRPVILAGGLKPANILEALEQAAPWGVDASSGLEKEPGYKDMDKVREFVGKVNKFSCSLEEHFEKG